MEEKRSWWQKSRLHSWWEKIRSGFGRLWQKMKRHPVMTAVIIIAGVLAITLIVVVVLGYWFNWPWVGVNGGYNKITTTTTTHGITTATEQPLTKSLWDWLQLLIIPLVLAVGALLFNFANSRTEQKVSLDKQRQDLLQAYIDKMSELLLKEHLDERTTDGKLKPEYEHVRNVARVRTITLLTQLDVRRIGYVFAFIREAELMSVTKDDNVISLKNADLHAVDWSQADLREADLRGANLSGANLSGAIFYSKIYVPRALSGTIPIPFNSADLREADLRGANLSGAKVADEQLDKAKSLQGATMPNGKIRDPGKSISSQL